MKKPKINALKYNKKETASLRRSAKNSKSIKITINIDAESMATLRELSDKSGIPYQRLLNRILSEGLDKRASTESRLDRLEKELKQIKKEIAA